MQERDAATRFIKEVDSKAQIMVKKKSVVKVVIYKLDEGDGETMIFSCPQRDLFSKNRHPAKGALQEAVKKHL